MANRETGIIRPEFLRMLQRLNSIINKQVSKYLKKPYCAVKPSSVSEAMKELRWIWYQDCPVPENVRSRSGPAYPAIKTRLNGELTISLI